MHILLLFLVVLMDIGTAPLVVVGGFAPAGLNVNNNYDNANDNIGLGALRKFYVTPPCIKCGGGRTLSTHQPFFQFLEQFFEFPDIAYCR